VEPVTDRVSIRAELYGDRLRREAKRQKITARDLAARIGVTESAVSRWFAGSREIGDDHRIAVAQALDVPVLALFPVMTAAGELVA
jgi:transcriptional regulator with XRE-family HTH domain